MNNEHIFEILGITSHEDSYTDLINYAFKNNQKFRENFLLLLGEQEDSEWNTEVRHQVKIKLNKRKKDVPDLILFNKKLNKILVIENKVHSGEGWEQTKRYADDKFKFKLKEYLNFKSEPNFKFFFLALDEEIEPSAKSFTKITYKDISKFIPESLGSSKLDILLKELKERLDEYYNLQPPKESDEVLNYLKNNQKRLINLYRTFQVLTRNLLNNQNKKELNGKPFTGKTHSPLPSNKNIYYCQWHKNSWKSKEFDKEINALKIEDAKKSYFIHFEFHLEEVNGSYTLNLNIHYEINKNLINRKERKKWKEQNQNFCNTYFNTYNLTRKEFFHYLKKNSPKDWKFKYKSLQLATYQFDKNIKFKELKEKTNELIKNTIPIIDEGLKKIT